ncbi:hypothetical protein ABIB73_000091 [Bradyrhizobium sp. F1.4.3]|uniref:hypothetical protein n=1 Tax=Bradyrhizobium sp. F1.4.3 TaxID=3156356 RepID=UPI00339863C9
MQHDLGIFAPGIIFGQNKAAVPIGELPVQLGAAKRRPRRAATPAPTSAPSPYVL